MTVLKNDRLIRALFREKVDRTPIWIMRQAGRYLPEYREIRQKAGTFMDLVQNPELATQVTLQPIDRFDLDAAILFSDILTIPHAMGLGLTFAAGEGPVFANPVRNAQDVAQLPIPDPHTELRYVIDTITMIQTQLAGRLPLIGFAGSPWTVACYMVEGSGSKEFSIIREMRYKNPQLLEQLLDKLIAATVLYLNAQIAAGVNAIMLFDTWGGLLTPEDYQQFSLTPMQKIIQQLNLQEKIPTIIFTKNGGQNLEAMANSGANALGIDWMTSLSDAKQRVGHKVALQGNLDPATLYGSPASLQQAAQAILRVYGEEPGHVFNLGHGIYPNIDPEQVAILVETVHNFRKK
ncbi:MAG: uroporphyrinogen decarboxylase [Gammaproteobacteria bacterium]|jgi:uroporphyrinogen decarboxylase